MTKNKTAKCKWCNHLLKDHHRSSKEFIKAGITKKGYFYCNNRKCYCSGNLESYR